MRILLVYPQYPDTYWSFKHALKFISKRASNIPLGLITVASLLPGHWIKKLTDLNVSKLRNKDIIRADYVFISAMNVQIASVRQIISRCRQLNTKIVAGGPLFTEEYEQFAEEIDHLVLNEAEITLPLFLEDLKNGCPGKIYRSEKFADITRSPLPDYSLVKSDKYGSAGIQYSRGCPYDCEFCDITALYGRRVRTKTSAQIISELDQLLRTGWRGTVFFVDDNFIGHKRKLKSELLPAMISWTRSNGRPFSFITEASIDLADDKELMDMMVSAGFSRVFVGIETPEESCLTECNKLHNNNRDLKECVNSIQSNGMEVCGGFIVGFDNDPPNIFQKQIDFIQKSGIITAMVGLLNAPRLSKLYQRLKNEGRITDSFGGDNTSYSMNFVPAMDKNELLKGYQKIIQDIYSCKPYYDRVKLFLKKYDPPFHEPLTLNRFMAFLKSIIYIGILKKESRYYWRLVLWSLFHKPKSFPLAITYSIYGYHFRRVFRNVR
ncbi:MAG: B12-binding domain-containing radical SAM protein [Bacteroidetes bacterium RBG_13_43_22]|nr:MAG: B12-binding domain-containing radical SAM protein [Bacteroidetes bacterium RBG_13_43_22]